MVQYTQQTAQVQGGGGGGGAPQMDTASMMMQMAGVYETFRQLGENARHRKTVKRLTNTMKTRPLNDSERVELSVANPQAAAIHQNERQLSLEVDKWKTEKERYEGQQQFRKEQQMQHSMVGIGLGLLQVDQSDLKTAVENTIWTLNESPDKDDHKKAMQLESAVLNKDGTKTYSRGRIRAFVEAHATSEAAVNRVMAQNELNARTDLANKELLAKERMAEAEAEARKYVADAQAGSRKYEVDQARRSEMDVLFEEAPDDLTIADLIRLRTAMGFQEDPAFAQGLIGGEVQGIKLEPWMETTTVGDYRNNRFNQGMTGAEANDAFLNELRQASGGGEQGGESATQTESSRLGNQMSFNREQTPPSAGDMEDLATLAGLGGMPETTGATPEQIAAHTGDQNVQQTDSGIQNIMGAEAGVGGVPEATGATPEQIAQAGTSPQPIDGEGQSAQRQMASRNEAGRTPEQKIASALTRKSGVSINGKGIKNLPAKEKRAILQLVKSGKADFFEMDDGTLLVVSKDDPSKVYTIQTKAK